MVVGVAILRGRLFMPHYETFEAVKASEATHPVVIVLFSTRKYMSGDVRSKKNFIVVLVNYI